MRSSVQKPREMRAFCGWLKNFGVFSRFYAYNFHVFRGYVQFWHAVRACVVWLPRYGGCVCEDSWFIKRFFASLVGASEFFVVGMRMEKLHVLSTFLRVPLEISVLLIFYKLFWTHGQHNYRAAEEASGGLWSRGLLLTRQPLYRAELPRHPKQSPISFLCTYF